MTSGEITFATFTRSPGVAVSMSSTVKRPVVAVSMLRTFSGPTSQAFLQSDFASAPVTASYGFVSHVKAKHIV